MLNSIKFDKYFYNYLVDCDLTDFKCTVLFSEFTYTLLLSWDYVCH